MSPFGYPAVECGDDMFDSVRGSGLNKKHVEKVDLFTPDGANYCRVVSETSDRGAMKAAVSCCLVNSGRLFAARLRCFRKHG
jgi:hypothetical protein